MRLKDKVAIVTGAAGGMGACTAKLFAKEGAKVVLADMIDADGQAVAREIGNTALYQHLDVTQESEWSALIAATLNSFGKLDILVNNAGISASHPDLFSTDIWDRVMDINAKGVFLGMKMAVPEMRKNGGGSIVNISSISGFVGQRIVHMGYNASKGAVRLMTKAVAVQFARDNVRVNSVHPGVMPPMRTSKLTGDPEVRKKLINAIPMGRAGRIEEVANASLFLASDEASYITGTEIVVDGGFLAQ
ncbi:MAG: glucose 1-dehydrogenase [Alphaproteobacteria bacterium]|nr:glucose 1-dehydrogenase [Alphaproteobacteria bacterium]